jgi:hypothetical protein
MLLRLRKMLAVCLALLLCAAVFFAVPFAASAAADGFVPVLRFVAASDTHVTGKGDVRTQRIANMLGKAYDVAAADPNHPALDAVLVVGDLTEDGTPEQFDAFRAAMEDGLQDGTRLLAVVAKNHDGYTQSRGDVRATCEALTGNGADFHAVLNGYHFIGVSASSDKNQHYDLGQLNWLNRQIAAAVKEDPNKPVFVMHHEPTVETVYGSFLFDGWGVPYFGAILRQYPQAVEICGHSHYPASDPRSVWQGAYTAINTGGLKNLEFTVDELRSYHPSDYYDVANCWIVEVNAQNDLRLRCIDVVSQTVLCEYILKNPADKANRDFTPAKRKAASKAPAFVADAALTAVPTEGGVKVTAPLAQSADGMPVILYRICAKNALGVPVAKGRTLAQYYRSDGADEVELTLSNLADGAYTLCVTAENAYGGQSEPLQTTVTVAGKKGLDHLLALIRQWFADLKDFFVHLFW